MTDLIKHIGQVQEIEFQDVNSLESVPLDELAIWINTGHAAIKFAVRRLAVHVAQVGAFLVAAKAKVNHGEWENWLTANCPEVHTATAWRYTQVYKRGESNLALMQDLTPMQAYKALGIVRDANDRTEIIEPLPPPEGTYHTIVIDPPWEMQKIERVLFPNQHGFDYQTKTVEQIADMRDEVLGIAAPNCHLYLWTTHKYLPSAIEIVQAWGFRYQCLMTWVKNVGFTPFSWMYSTEHILFCRRGNLPLLRKGLRLDFNAKVREHSRKPDEFYELIKEVSPKPRLDWFSRESREGFDSWGAERGKF